MRGFFDKATHDHSDEMELNETWRELPTMARISPTGRDYDMAVAGAMAAGYERGRQEAQQEAREAREMEHCREHMGSAHGEGLFMSSDGNCVLAAGFDACLTADSRDLATGTALASVHELIGFRLANGV